MFTPEMASSYQIRDATPEEDPEPWVKMGNTLQQLGRHQKARQAFRVAETLSASPTS